MRIYIVMQDEGNGYKSVRRVFLDKVEAEEFIGPQDDRPTIPCDSCGQQRPNPVYSELEEWKPKLSIQEWGVQE